MGIGLGVALLLISFYRGRFLLPVILFGLPTVLSYAAVAYARHAESKDVLLEFVAMRPIVAIVCFAGLAFTAFNPTDA